MRYTPKYFHDGLPAWKRKKDPILSRIFYRPLSFVIAAPIASVGISANAVSYFSMLVALIACAAFAAGFPIVGALLINAWLVLDCVDGNIARCVRSELYGEYADSMSSYVCVGFMFSCMGFCAYQIGGVVFESGNPLVILIGALASSCDSLMRLGYQKFQVVGFGMGVNNHVDQNPELASGLDALRIKIDAYLSLGGFLPIIVLLAALVNALDVVVCLWAVYYATAFLASTSYLIAKTVKANAKTTHDFR